MSDDSIPRPYELHPPAWLPKIHVSADLGYAGFYPPRPGQDEDILSEGNVKNGFVLGQQIAAEHFSAQTLMNDESQSADALSMLEALMDEVFNRRASSLPSVPPSTFRIPPRVTLNDSKRSAWFADLANPDVPLQKLGKSVPHGAKGHDLLDLLHVNNVAIPRAIWFLRVFGANETAGLRNKPTYNPNQYSIDWANIVTGYMKKQLSDIALPSAPRPGLNVKHNFKGVLMDKDTRERWVSRFIYCLKLLRAFFSEGLVDHRTFLTWLVQQMGNCNLAQASFVIYLADEYLDSMTNCLALSRPFVDACLSKLNEIRMTSAQQSLVDTQRLLKALLQVEKRLCISSPDSFISPKTWLSYSNLIEEILLNDISGDSPDLRRNEGSSNDLHRIISDLFHDIRRRNETMLFQNMPFHASNRLDSALTDIKLLNSISTNTDLRGLDFFVGLATDIPSAFSEKLDLLLTWAVTQSQYGKHRPYAAVTLLRHWREKTGDRAVRRHLHPPDEMLQDGLFDWLDSSKVAGDIKNLGAVTLLYGRLVKQELFSYSAYLQRLIARGESGLSVADESKSRHRKFLQHIPLHRTTLSLINQRKVVLYGARIREIPEDADERELRREIRTVLPEFFNGGPSTVSLQELPIVLVHTLSSTRFEQVRTIEEWLLPILRNRISELEMQENRTMPIKSYCVAVEVMNRITCFDAMLELTLYFLEHSASIDVLITAIDTLHRFATIWACMDATSRVVAALDTAHQVWKARGVQSRPLLSLLLELDNARYLAPQSRERVNADISAFTIALQPFTEHPTDVPDVLTEILLLAGDPNEDAPSILANSLWIKYRMSFDWAWKVWDNTFASLRQIPAMTEELEGRRACALRYATFLWHIDQHLATGLDAEVLRWLLGPGKSELVVLHADVWDAFVVTLIFLIAHGSLKTTTILEGLIYPAWHLAASHSSDARDGSMDTFLCAANTLCRLLLLPEAGDEAGVLTELYDIQRIQTRRQYAYSTTHFPLLASSVPLLVLIEHNVNLSDASRSDSIALRHGLCRDNHFRQGAYRHLDTIRDAFEQPLEFAGELDGDMSRHMVDGLRMLLCDTFDELSEWPTAASLLSPWNMSATMVQMRLVFKQLARDLADDKTRQTAVSNLDHLVLKFLHHSMSSEEAYYISEMTRNVNKEVAQRFINIGFRCITENLNQTSLENDSLLRPLRQISELLRVLVSVADPIGSYSTTLGLESSVQEEFLANLSGKLQCVASTVASSESLSHEQHQIAGILILCCRLLHFELRFQRVWTTKTSESCEVITSSLLGLALNVGASDAYDASLFSLIVDTLCYVCDEKPLDIRTAPFDPFRNYSQMPATDLPSDLSTDHRNRLLALLPYAPHIGSVSNLVHSSRDAAGNATYTGAVVNRPWEWIEHLGDAATPDSKDAQKDGAADPKYSVKNSASLPLDVFASRITGDGILRNPQCEGDSNLEGNLRCLEDGLSADNVFKRDWRETRVDNAARQTFHPRRDDLTGETLGNSKMDKRLASRASPASSIVSRSSIRASAGWSRQSPGQGSNRGSNANLNEPFEVESVTSTSSSRSGKRKSEVAVISDDEIEIIEGPYPIRQSRRRIKSKPGPKATKVKKG